MIDTIVFDYGLVLAYPTTGNWFTTPNTKNILGEADYNTFVSSPDEREAYAKAFRKIDEVLKLSTDEEEIELFTEFYSIVFSAVGIADPNGEKARSMAEDETLNDDKIRFYSDVRPFLEKHRGEYKIMLLTDNWPSYRRVLNNAGLTDFFDGIIGSCDYGELKSGTKLFEIAAREWEIDPKTTVFVDDSPLNLRNSEKLGFNPVLMSRDEPVLTDEFRVVHNLEGLETVLRTMNTENMNSHFTKRY